MCDLTTAWILESAQRLSVRTYHNMDLNKNLDVTGSRSCGKWIIQASTWEENLDRSRGSSLLVGDPSRRGEHY